MFLIRDYLTVVLAAVEFKLKLELLVMHYIDLCVKLDIFVAQVMSKNVK